ncbi:MAG TPA: DUF5329 domain-containing protein [Ramlibacter sp.]|uniref:DUF5329 domain-containing protein n=1 Tax=Ramlibacter sp. TaxID=1917967 RepID=UPI002ED56254
MRWMLSGCLLAWALSSAAAPVPPAARAEIDALLAKLQSSGCTFNRNGTWHGADEAQAHLRRKLEALEERNVVQTTEQFIALGASTSSVSSKPYLVKCGGGTPVESRVWLTNELKALRSKAK